MDGAYEFGGVVHADQHDPGPNVAQSLVPRRNVTFQLEPHERG